MTVPCTQETPIREMQVDIKAVGENVDRLCSSNAELIVEMKDMTKNLVEHMIDNREHHVKIRTLEKNSDMVFNRIRRLEDDLCPGMQNSLQKLSQDFESIEDVPKKIEVLENWNSKIKGVVLIVPVSCTVLSAIAAVIAIFLQIKS